MMHKHKNLIEQSKKSSASGTNLTPCQVLHNLKQTVFIKVAEYECTFEVSRPDSPTLINTELYPLPHVAPLKSTRF